MAQLTEFLLPPEERDCTLVLLLPAEIETATAADAVHKLPGGQTATAVAAGAQNAVTAPATATQAAPAGQPATWGGLHGAGPSATPQAAGAVKTEMRVVDEAATAATAAVSAAAAASAAQGATSAGASMAGTSAAAVGEAALSPAAAHAAAEAAATASEAPGAAAAGPADEGPPTKRARQDPQQDRQQASNAAVQVAAPPPRRIELPACSLALKIFSQKFRDWAARWAEGGAKEYAVVCRDEAEVATYRQLLDFMHSMGNSLPTDPAEVLQLLLLAREHAVEAAVLACIRLLQKQAIQLPARTCLCLLTSLESGVSGEASIQVPANRLLDACCHRLRMLFKAEGALQDAEERGMLLQLLCPLQEMLNDRLRRKLFLALPFPVLRDFVLDDATVWADTETTVLAATLDWLAVRNNGGALTAEQLGQLFSRIRFPAVPASTLVNYHRCFAALLRFDGSKGLLLAAMSSAAEPAQGEAWRQALAAAEPGSALGVMKRKVERWWTPRPLPLPGIFAHQELRFQVRRPGGAATTASTDPAFYAGYWWRVELENEGHASVYIIPQTSHEKSDLDEEDSMLLCGLRARYMLYLSHRLGGEDLLLDAVKWFVPPDCSGWGKVPLRDKRATAPQPLSWGAFWGEGSPYCCDGVVWGRLLLLPPPQPVTAAPTVNALLGGLLPPAVNL
ncbi:hypothetical protein ABPG75_000743 [Micractinium tetrahymenae]